MAAEQVKVTAEVASTPGIKHKDENSWAEIELRVDGQRNKRPYRSFDDPIKKIVERGELVAGQRYIFMVSEFRKGDDGPLFRNVHEVVGPAESSEPPRPPAQDGPRGREAAFSADPVKLSSEEARSALHAAVEFVGRGYNNFDAEAFALAVTEGRAHVVDRPDVPEVHPGQQDRGPCRARTGPSPSPDG